MVENDVISGIPNEPPGNGIEINIFKRRIGLKIANIINKGVRIVKVRKRGKQPFSINHFYHIMSKRTVKE